MDSIVKFDNVGLRIGKKNILEDISFSVSKKSIVCLYGKNGSGKTSLLKLLMGISSLRKGKLEVDCSKERIGIHLKDVFLIKKFTVKEFVAFIFETKDIDNKAYVNFLLSEFDMNQYGDTLILNLSEGNKAKLSLLTAMIHSPDLLVLDEPFVGMDLTARTKAIDLLRDLNRTQGATIMYTSHILDENNTLVDRAILLENGRVVIDKNVLNSGCLEEIFNRL